MNQEALRQLARSRTWRSVSSPILDPRCSTSQPQVFAALQGLPGTSSTAVDRLPAELARRDRECAAPRRAGSRRWRAPECRGVLISWDGRPVDYSALLAARYVNLVPVREPCDVLEPASRRSRRRAGCSRSSLREPLRDAPGARRRPAGCHLWAWPLQAATTRPSHKTDRGAATHVPLDRRRRRPSPVGSRGPSRASTRPRPAGSLALRHPTLDRHCTDAIKPMEPRCRT